MFTNVVSAGFTVQFQNKLSKIRLLINLIGQVAMINWTNFDTFNNSCFDFQIILTYGFVGKFLPAAAIVSDSQCTVVTQLYYS